jgi:RNA binding exosome subunit
LKSSIQSVEISFIVHATEDKTRVQDSVRSLIGVEAEMVEDELEGHHGNKILRISSRTTGGVASDVFEKLVAGLSKESKKEVTSNIRRMMDEHSALFLRLNKQSLIRGRIELGGDETVRVKIKPRIFQLRQGAEGFYRDLFARAS